MAMIKLLDLPLLVGAAADPDRAPATGLTTAMPAAGLLVGIDAHGRGTPPDTVAA
jgi:hypothetical protein